MHFLSVKYAASEHCVPKNLNIVNNYIDLNFEHFEIFKYIVSYLGTLFVQEYFCQMLCQGFKKNIS